MDKLEEMGMALLRLLMNFFVFLGVEAEGGGRGSDGPTCWKQR